jgi:hypothetical protein
MSEYEKYLEKLAQCIFRIETNAQTMHNTSNPNIIGECFVAIMRDVESLKEIKIKLREECL